MGYGYGLCQRCGFRYELDDLRKEWTNLRVCKTCWDPRPPYFSQPQIGAEGVARKDASPEPADTFLTDNQVTPDSL